MRKRLIATGLYLTIMSVGCENAPTSPTPTSTTSTTTSTSTSTPRSTSTTSTTTTTASSISDAEDDVAVHSTASGAAGPMAVSGITRLPTPYKCGGERWWRVEGSYTQAQAWDLAKKYKNNKGVVGRAVVVSNEAEFRAIVSDCQLPQRKSAYHTGMYQASEPNGKWVTITNETGFFWWNGPGQWGAADDGCTNGLVSWIIGNGGVQLEWGPSCKGESAAVFWTDNGGKFEDVSKNHKAGVIIEFE